MSHAGAAFWASQGMKENERGKKVGFEPYDEKGFEPHDEESI